MMTVIYIIKEFRSIKITEKVIVDFYVNIIRRFLERMENNEVKDLSMVKDGREFNETSWYSKIK